MNLATEFINRFSQLINDGKHPVTATQIAIEEFTFKIDNVGTDEYHLLFIDGSHCNYHRNNRNFTL